MKDLYIIQSDVTGSFKVGRSKHIKKRLKQLQTGAAYSLKLILSLPGQGNRELSIHRRLREMKFIDTKGEWFPYEALSWLPDDIYEQLDLELVDRWWRHEKDQST